MIKIENVEIVGLEPAIRGMRNPMNSWDKIDSGLVRKTELIYDDFGSVCGYRAKEVFEVGPDDLELMQKLAKSGSDHAKYRRMIVVYLDIIAPLYWWKEFDTYKVGTVANSCSTMHKIHAKEFTLDDFSYEHLVSNGAIMEPRSNNNWDAKGALMHIVDVLNYFRDHYLSHPENKTYWWQMIQLLPSSYNQRRTIMLNYEVLANIYHSRKNHKLDEWREFCEWIETLPYAEGIIFEEDDNDKTKTNGLTDSEPDISADDNISGD